SYDKPIRIGDRTITPTELEKMSPEARRDLSWEWVNADPLRRESYNRVAAQRDAYRAANPELDAYLTWREGVYRTGPAAYRQQVIAANPAAAAYFEERRARAVSEYGAKPEAIEEQLNRDTVSMDAYFAVHGIADSKFDAPPKPTNTDGSEVPFDPIAAPDEATDPNRYPPEVYRANETFGRMIGDPSFRIEYLPPEYQEVFIRELPPAEQA